MSDLDRRAAPPGKLPGNLATNPRLDRWLAFDAAGHVVVTPGKVELGQGILTALAQIVAEELDVAMARVRLQAAATPDSPNEGVTSGSLSVQDSGMALRHVAAAARAIHLQVAAQRSGVPVEALRVEDGAFLAPDGRAIGSYWAQADAALLACEAPVDARPKPPGERRIAGTSAARIDLPDKVFGAPRFVHDLRLPGMLHARVVRPPARQARLVGLREGALPEGVVIARDGSFLAVVAGSEHDAERAAERLAARATWQATDTLPDPGALADWLRAAPGDHAVIAERDEAAGAATRTIRATFFRPYVTHASVGTSCAVARWQDGTLEVWSHTQGVYNLRADLAKALRMKEEAILVRHMEGAGCYGHNGADDVALDAALAAHAVPGRPVRLLWSRAEELGWGPVSSAMVVEIEAGLDAAGNIATWREEVVSHGHSSRPGRDPNPTLLAVEYMDPPRRIPNAINPPLASGGGAQRNAIPAYRIPRMTIGLKRIAEMPLRCSALRGLGAPVNVLAIESVMEDLAAAAGEDPLDFRLRHLDDPRGRDVLALAAEMCGWRGRAKREGFGLGLAYARYKHTGAYCAVAAEIEALDRVVCRRLWIAADVGEVINPDGVMNQYEGGAIHGVSMALKEQVAFDRRTVTGTRWEDYPILRFSEVPTVETRLIPRPEEKPLGAGEASLAPAVAAIANAIHDALGIRPRAMPFTPDTLATA
ncbi:xanthine dehydrogenase family protein molybdopterin-binding subunit [Roseomonas sp. JC162]|uniref:Xanthine dehydrogenase family protein molybdopterin-binding subunit n=1 Tax=Neoroseomonas marina TaxID=1232220 RepID=A0A848EAX1_9PROT|nr:molybdopterin cofactor-binding domain-containing protein [Neoroseomonas marina]NMJ41664.1 xanthine dehydrogenase family protein molybdopterin-binding subunit [Neoroseomonas marina]